MTKIEAEALVLFKEHTHLQLKTFQIANTPLSEEEEVILEKALEYHRHYISMKLKSNKYAKGSNGKK